MITWKNWMNHLEDPETKTKKKKTINPPFLIIHDSRYSLFLSLYSPSNLVYLKVRVILWKDSLWVHQISGHASYNYRYYRIEFSNNSTNHTTQDTLLELILQQNHKVLHSLSNDDFSRIYPLIEQIIGVSSEWNPLSGYYHQGVLYEYFLELLNGESLVYKIRRCCYCNTFYFWEQILYDLYLLFFTHEIHLRCKKIEIKI